MAVSMANAYSPCFWDSGSLGTQTGKSDCANVRYDSDEDFDYFMVPMYTSLCLDAGSGSTPVTFSAQITDGEVVAKGAKFSCTDQYFTKVVVERKTQGFHGSTYAYITPVAMSSEPYCSNEDEVITKGGSDKVCVDDSYLGVSGGGGFSESCDDHGGIDPADPAYCMDGTDAPPSAPVGPTPTGSGGGGKATVTPSAPPQSLVGGPAVNNSIKFSLPNPLKAKSLICFIYSTVNIIIDVLAIVAALYIIWAGFQFVAAQGNEAKLKAAKQSFVNAIIGTAILLGSWAIISFVIQTVNGITSSSLPGAPSAEICPK